MLSKLSVVFGIVALLGATPVEAQQFGGLFCPPQPCPPPLVLAPIVVIPETLLYGRDDCQVFPGDLLWEGGITVTSINPEAREVTGMLVGPGFATPVVFPCNEEVFAFLSTEGYYSIRGKTRRVFTFELGWTKVRSIHSVSLGVDLGQPAPLPLLTPTPAQGNETVIPSRKYSPSPTPIEQGPALPEPLPPVPAPSTEVLPSGKDNSVDEEESAPKPIKIRQPIAKKGTTVLK